ncbi:MAG: hypothetical protein ACO3V2_05770 [Ilumatobacteraceae bacterium]
MSLELYGVGAGTRSRVDELMCNVEIAVMGLRNLGNYQMVPAK